MTIYRVLECSGQWEDYFEYHLGTYSSYKKALDVKNEHENKEKESAKQAKMCENCEYGCGKNPKCLGFKPLDYEEDECANYVTNWEESIFKIEEEEVLD